jgi:hypothetical protein
LGQVFLGTLRLSISTCGFFDWHCRFLWGGEPCFSVFGLRVFLLVGINACKATQWRPSSTLRPSGTPPSPVGGSNCTQPYPPLCCCGVALLSRGCLCSGRCSPVRGEGTCCCYCCVRDLRCLLLLLTLLCPPHPRLLVSPLIPVSWCPPSHPAPCSRPITTLAALLSLCPHQHANDDQHAGVLSAPVPVEGPGAGDPRADGGSVLRGCHMPLHSALPRTHVCMRLCACAAVIGSYRVWCVWWGGREGGREGGGGRLQLLSGWVC